MSNIMSFRIDDVIRKRLRASAKDRKQSMSIIVNESLHEHFQHTDVLVQRIEELSALVTHLHGQVLNRMEWQLERMGELAALLVEENAASTHLQPTPSAMPTPPAQTSSSVEQHWDQVNKLNQ